MRKNGELPEKPQGQKRKENFTDMAVMTRKEAREEAFRLLFETEFRTDEDPNEIFAISEENREVASNSYIKTVYFGVQEHLDEIDALIVRHSNGWKVTRLTRVSRAVIRLCVYEMANVKDVPAAVAINEAIELSKKFDDEKARGFVNGVLNAIKAEFDGNAK